MAAEEVVDNWRAMQDALAAKQAQVLAAGVPQTLTGQRAVLLTVHNVHENGTAVNSPVRRSSAKYVRSC